jgi:hypothetical protein
MLSAATIGSHVFKRPTAPRSTLHARRSYAYRLTGEISASLKKCKFMMVGWKRDGGDSAPASPLHFEDSS